VPYFYDCGGVFSDRKYIPDTGSGELQGLSYTVALFLWLPKTCAELLPVSEIFPNLTSLFSSEVVSSTMTIPLELPAESKLLFGASSLLQWR